MINIVDKDIFKRMLATIVLLIIFSLPLIDKNTMFLFKETQKTHGIIKYIDLNENKVWVEYEVDGVKYFETIDNGAFVTEKDSEIGLLYDINNPEKAMEESGKSTRLVALVIVIICLCSLVSLKTEYKGNKIYNDKKAKIVKGKIFETVNNGAIYRVCLKVDEEDQIFYLDSDINLEPILEKLKIETLPIYLIGKHFYRVDSRPIEEKIEIIQEKIFFLSKKKK